MEFKIKEKKEGMVPEESSGQGLSIYSFMKHPLSFINLFKRKTNMLTFKTDDEQKVHWSVERCHDSHKFFTEDNRPTPVTECIIKCTIVLGINKITPRSMIELFRRCKIHEYLNGPVMWKEGQPVGITLLLLNQFVGAYHDGPAITDSKFRLLIEKWVLRNVQAKLDEESIPATEKSKQPVEVQ